MMGQGVGVEEINYTAIAGKEEDELWFSGVGVG